MTPQDRIEQLEEQVAYLKSELGLTKDASQLACLKENLRLTDKQAEILMALRASNGRVISPGFLLDNFTNATDEKVIDIHVCRIRKTIGFNTIGTVRGKGFYITSEGKSRVDLALTQA